MRKVRGTEINKNNNNEKSEVLYKASKQELPTLYVCGCPSFNDHIMLGHLAKMQVYEVPIILTWYKVHDGE